MIMIVTLTVWICLQTEYVDLFFLHLVMLKQHVVVGVHVEINAQDAQTIPDQFVVVMDYHITIYAVLTASRFNVNLNLWACCSQQNEDIVDIR